MATPARLPDNEAERLAALDSYQILDTAPEEDFDDVARLASYICDTPIAMVSLIDADRQWFKANIGPVPVRETSRDLSICAHTILSDELCVVPDAALDPRFFDNPFVTGGYPQVRFYAGAPLVTEAGIRLGSLCVIDTKARELTQKQRDSLTALGRQVVKLFELRRASIRMQEMLKAKEEFLRIASHDLKNPLTAILCGAHIVQESAMSDPITPEQIQTLGSVAESMIRQSTQMSRLITDYLDQQAVEDGGIALERELQDIEPTLTEVARDMESAARRKGARINMEVVGPLPRASFDSPRISQVVRNLVANALKFSPTKRDLTLKARACEMLPDNLYVPRGSVGKTGQVPVLEASQYLLVEVMDAGPGILQEDAPKLFSKYGKLSAKPTGGEESTGHGLNICRQMIELHGGKIGVFNNAGGGSTFWFALPADVENPAA
ncbi:GAF domain-containing sensor histidine kinase [soil metagenome]